MKQRYVLVAAPLWLVGCGGGDLSLAVTSDDLGENTQQLVTAADLTSVRSVNVTVDEIWVHVSDKDSKDDVKGEDVPDDGEGWEQVASDDLPLDLMTVRNQATRPLGDFPLPEGKVDQIRLRLKTDGELGDRRRITGAVTEQDGTVCDLSVPASVIEPGLKITGLLKAMKIESGGKHRALLNLKIKDSARLDGAACVYKLDPVLKVKSYEQVAGEGSK